MQRGASQRWYALSGYGPTELYAVETYHAAVQRPGLPAKFSQPAWRNGEPVEVATYRSLGTAAFFPP